MARRLFPAVLGLFRRLSEASLEADSSRLALDKTERKKRRFSFFNWEKAQELYIKYISAGRARFEINIRYSERERLRTLLDTSLRRKMTVGMQEMQVPVKIDSQISGVDSTGTGTTQTQTQTSDTGPGDEGSMFERDSRMLWRLFDSSIDEMKAFGSRSSVRMCNLGKKGGLEFSELGSIQTLGDIDSQGAGGL